MTVKDAQKLIGRYSLLHTTGAQLYNHIQSSTEMKEKARALEDDLNLSMHVETFLEEVMSILSSEMSRVDQAIMNTEVNL